MSEPVDVPHGNPNQEPRPMPRFPQLERARFNSTNMERRIDFWHQTTNAWTGKTQFELTPQQQQLQRQARDLIDIARGQFLYMANSNLGSAAFTAMMDQITGETVDSAAAFSQFVQRAEAQTGLQNLSDADFLYILAESAFARTRSYIAGHQDLRSAILRQGGSLERVVLNHNEKQYVVYRNFEVDPNSKQVQYTRDAGSDLMADYIVFAFDEQGRVSNVMDDNSQKAQVIFSSSEVISIEGLVQRADLIREVETRPWQPHERQNLSEHSEETHMPESSEARRIRDNRIFAYDRAENAMRKELIQMVSCLIVMDALRADNKALMSMASHYGQDTLNEIQEFLAEAGITVYKTVSFGDYANVFSGDPLTNEALLAYATREGSPEYILDIIPQQQPSGINIERLEEMQDWIKRARESSVGTMFIDAGFAAHGSTDGPLTMSETVISSEGKASKREIHGGLSAVAGRAIRNVYDHLYDIPARSVESGSDHFALGIKVQSA